MVEGKTPDEMRTGCERSCKKVEIPTEDEVAALNAMREIKTRVRDLRDRLALLSASGKPLDAEHVSAMERELARLKEEWREWEEKRKEAARERMAVLGHEE